MGRIATKATQITSSNRIYDFIFHKQQNDIVGQFCLRVHLSRGFFLGLEKEMIGNEQRLLARWAHQPRGVAINLRMRTTIPLLKMSGNNSPFKLVCFVFPFQTT